MKGPEEKHGCGWGWFLEEFGQGGGAEKLNSHSKAPSRKNVTLQYYWTFKSRMGNFNARERNADFLINVNGYFTNLSSFNKH